MGDTQDPDSVCQVPQLGFGDVIQNQGEGAMFLTRAVLHGGNALTFREFSTAVAEFIDKVICPREVNVLNFIPVIHLYHAFRHVNNNYQ